MAADEFFHTFCQSRGFIKKKVAYIAGGKIRTKQEEVSSVNMKNTASRQAESGITVLYPFLCGRRAV